MNLYLGYKKMEERGVRNTFVQGRSAESSSPACFPVI